MKFIDKFCEILNEQLALHENLLSLSEEKKEILINGSLARLEQIVKEEHKLIQEVSYLEKDRYAMIRQLAEALRIEVEKITVSFLIEVVQDENDKHRLTKLKDSLEEVVKELGDINELNAKLLEQSLEYIQTTMEIITDDPDQEAVYTNPAKANMRKGRSIFDAKS